MCIILDRMAVAFYCSTLVFTSLLFFFRTRAVFHSYPWVIAFFAGMWLVVLGGFLSFVVHIFKSTGSPSPSVCLISSGVDPYIAVATIISLTNDTLVFLAITWGLFRTSYNPLSLQCGFRFMVFGDYLPVFSRVLLRDGQAYYLLATFLICLIVLKYLTMMFFLSTGPSLP